MKITDIKIQSHKKNRASVFVDDEYAFALDLTDVLRFGLKAGIEITSDDIEKYNREGNWAKVRDKAMDVISRKAVSKKALKDLLVHKGYDSTMCDEVICELSDIGYIDDVSFAKSYAEDAFEYKKHGKKRIEADLRKKGVSSSDIAEALSLVDFDASENITHLLEAKFKNADVSDIKVKNKMIRYLAYRGYNMGDIINAIDRMR